MPVTSARLPSDPLYIDPGGARPRPPASRALPAAATPGYHVIKLTSSLSLALPLSSIVIYFFRVFYIYFYLLLIYSFFHLFVFYSFLFIRFFIIFCLFINSFFFVCIKFYFFHLYWFFYLLFINLLIFHLFIFFFIYIRFISFVY